MRPPSPPDFDIVWLLAGQKSAGKDVQSEYLVGQGFAAYRLSDTLRAEADRRNGPGVSYTVQQLQDIGDEFRRDRGAGCLAEGVLELARAAGRRKVVINGLRNPAEIEAARRIAGERCILTGVVAPLTVRHARDLKRKQKGAPTTLEQFLADDDRDRGIGQPADGQQVDRCLAMVAHEDLYHNAGTLEEYLTWIAARHAKANTLLQALVAFGEF